MPAIQGLSSLPVVQVTLCVLFLEFVASGQGASVKTPAAAGLPSAVTAALHTIFPDATLRGPVTIERNNVVCYSIGIIDGGEKREVVFSADGAIREVIDSIGFGSLPGPVQQALSRNYPRAKIIEANKKTTGGGYEYIVEAAVEKDTLELTFTHASMVISSKHCAKKLLTEKNTGLAQK